MSANIAYFGGIVTSGLVLCLDAAKRDSYPGTGTVWNSVARGNQISGSLVNGPTFNISNGGSIGFDGTNDYADLGQTFNFTSEDFSFSYWANFNTLTTNQVGQGPIVIYKGSYRVNGYYDQVSNSVYPGGIVFVTNQSGVEQFTVTNNNLITTGSWYNIGYTRSGSSVSIYINGAYSNSGSAVHVNPTSAASNNFRLANYENGLILGNFKLSNFITYNRALSATEVLQNYNALKGRFGLP